MYCYLELFTDDVINVDSIHVNVDIDTKSEWLILKIDKNVNHFPEKIDTMGQQLYHRYNQRE